MTSRTAFSCSADSNDMPRCVLWSEVTSTNVECDSTSTAEPARPATCWLRVGLRELRQLGSIIHDGCVGGSPQAPKDGRPGSRTPGDVASTAKRFSAGPGAHERRAKLHGRPFRSQTMGSRRKGS